MFSNLLVFAYVIPTFFVPGILLSPTEIIHSYPMPISNAAFSKMPDKKLVLFFPVPPSLPPFSHCY